MRIAVLSDIHANLDALEAVLADAGSVDAVWQLGDVVGYGPDPDAVVGRLAAIGAAGVRGNHDAAACGDLDVEWFNPEARRAIEWTRDVISNQTRGWLTALPERWSSGDFSLVHGSPRDPTWEYVLSPSVARGGLADLATRHGLHGHTHIPLAWRTEGSQVAAIDAAEERILTLDGRSALLNPGSVGQPRDGDPRASWALLDTVAGTFEWRRVAYDIATVQARMTDLGLPHSLVTRLALGR
jgi:diadenosine tetraphosphatase ApaH/serine/threonine PP2A family protein phosphatase